MDHRIFEYQMMDLAKRDCRVVAIDLRGFGQSDKPWEGNDYDTWAADIGKVIAELILRDVTLVGFSMGGAIAAHYVSRRIDTRISKLALISAPVLNAYPKPEDRQAVEETIKLLQTERPRFMLDHVKKHDQYAHEPREQGMVGLARHAGVRAGVHTRAGGAARPRPAGPLSAISACLHGSFTAGWTRSSPIRSPRRR